MKKLGPRAKLIGLLAVVSIVSACVGAWVASGPNTGSKILRYLLIDRKIADNVRRDTEKVRRDAETGNAEAQFWLGFRYNFPGRGEEKNVAEAVKWYRKSAEQGYASAQIYLGNCYRSGTGVKKDYVEAYAWYELAATSGNKDPGDGRIEYPAPAARKDLEKEMSPEQITAGQKRSGELQAQIAVKLKSGGK